MKKVSMVIVGISVSGFLMWLFNISLTIVIDTIIGVFATFIIGLFAG